MLIQFIYIWALHSESPCKWRGSPDSRHFNQHSECITVPKDGTPSWNKQHTITLLPLCKLPRFRDPSPLSCAKPLTALTHPLRACSLSSHLPFEASRQWRNTLNGVPVCFMYLECVLGLANPATGKTCRTYSTKSWSGSKPTRPAKA